LHEFQTGVVHFLHGNAFEAPDTLSGYQALSGAGKKTGHLDAKTRELIALAVAVTSRCDGCITVHTDAAVKNGATREEVADFS
jgi:AhpD family alkylhydroperoxidase